MECACAVHQGWVGANGGESLLTSLCLICVLVGGLMLVITICFTPVATPTQKPLLLPQANVKIASNLHGMSIYAHAGR